MRGGGAAYSCFPPPDCSRHKAVPGPGRPARSSQKNRHPITDNSHGQTDTPDLNTIPSERPLVTKGPVIIEDNVWIGDKATILPGVRIGRGSIIGANAVVVKSVPPHSLVGGNPATVRRIMHPADKEAPR